MKNVLGCRARLRSRLRGDTSDGDSAGTNPPCECPTINTRPINSICRVATICPRTLAGSTRAYSFSSRCSIKIRTMLSRMPGLPKAMASSLLWRGIAQRCVPKAKTAALKALELDNSLAEAHTLWDLCSCTGTGIGGAEKELLQAIDLKQSYVVAHHWYAEYLSAMDAMSKPSRDQDRPGTRSGFASHARIGGESAIMQALRRGHKQCLKAIEIDPNFGWPRKPFWCVQKKRDVQRIHYRS